MSKHTAGPWDVETSIKAFIPKSQGGGEKIRIMAGSGETRRRICSLNVENLSQAKIDARLIAAAPELFHTVVEVANSLDFVLSALPEKVRPGVGAVIDELRKAIAKAEGRHV